MLQVTPVILYGGSGTRLWLLSRAGFPKQFLSLTGDESLFQQAAQRLMALGAAGVEVAKPLIVTGEEHRFLAAEQLHEASLELGEVHRLANPGTIPLEIIEVQSGSYLGEDDIVRFDDHYGRSEQ